MTVDAVLFDLDNTLYPYEPCHEAGKEAAFQAACDRGYALERDEFDERYAQARADVKRNLPGRAASHERYLYFKRFIELLTGEPQPGDSLALGDAFWSGYINEMSLFPGVEETFRALRDATVDIGIVTNLTTCIQLAKLQRLGLESGIDVLVTSEETGQEKPAAVMFTLPLARLECHPSNAVMVGDNSEADIAGANAVGLETVLWNGDESAHTGRTRPDHTITQFTDLLEIVR